MNVDIINKSQNENPKYATSGSSGMDLRANIEEPVVLMMGERKLIPTGIHIQLPEGYEAQVRPRSGLALKAGVTVCNAPGTVDSDYTGDIGVILINLGHEPFTIYKGDRIAQLVVAKYERVEWNVVSELKAAERKSDGFGHTGIR